MAVSSVNNSASSTNGGKSNRQIAGDFQAFLLLLTTQLKNQNPLDPMKANEFTQQLVQFASVEQQLKTNDTLGALLNAAQSTNLTNAVSFVGKTITADGSTTALKNSSAKWNVNLPKAARTMTLIVTDASGNVVWTETKSMTEGDNAYTWNGRTSTGQTSLDGDYKLTVEAVDDAGAKITPSLSFSGVVDGVSVKDGVPVLKVGDRTITLDKILSVSR